jgi:ketosteroid isomerase-like protein
VADRLDSLFAAIDAKDTAGFLAFLAGDASFRFGSAPALVGHDAIREGVEGFFASIKASKHVLANVLRKDTTLVCEGEVTYTRSDDSAITLPFTNVFELDGNRIADYKIYSDIAPLYAS